MYVVRQDATLWTQSIGTVACNCRCFSEILKPYNSRYLQTWFFIDLISSLPLDYIISAVTSLEETQLVGASRALRVLRLAKLLSLLRLLRVTRLVRYVSQYEVVSCIFNAPNLWEWHRAYQVYQGIITCRTVVLNIRAHNAQNPY